jgi:hypothetical protein
MKPRASRERVGPSSPCSAGYRFGKTRSRQRPCASSTRHTSPSTSSATPGQNGHGRADERVLDRPRRRSSGRSPRSGATMTQDRVSRSCRNSDMDRSCSWLSSRRRPTRIGSAKVFVGARRRGHRAPYRPCSDTVANPSEPSPKLSEHHSGRWLEVAWFNFGIYSGKGGRAGFNAVPAMRVAVSTE